ncbi:MAG: FlgD immunoglobulin-like domain containing protein, partial [Gemmatimonadota bacterium]|nr:FlgD immunoglobulin-like domain containing protein [Gemmatimonadota bacterium]
YPSVLTPDESLDALLGEDISGSWSLDISDNAGADTGTLNQWCLRLTYGSGATDAVVGRPAVTQLLGSFPNPFTSATHIAFELAGETRVHIDIHDVTGRRVATVVDELLPPGQHQPAWDGRDSQGLRTASGVYFYRFRAGEVAETKKVVLTR